MNPLDKHYYSLFYDYSQVMNQKIKYTYYSVRGV